MKKMKREERCLHRGGRGGGEGERLHLYRENNFF